MGATTMHDSSLGIKDPSKWNLWDKLSFRWMNK